MLCFCKVAFSFRRCVARVFVRVVVLCVQLAVDEATRKEAEARAAEAGVKLAAAEVCFSVVMRIRLHLCMFHSVPGRRRRRRKGLLRRAWSVLGDCVRAYVCNLCMDAVYV